jgi:hypothetical protein
MMRSDSRTGATVTDGKGTLEYCRKERARAVGFADIVVVTLTPVKVNTHGRKPLISPWILLLRKL